MCLLYHKKSPVRIMTKMTLSLEIRGVSSTYNIDPCCLYISSPQHSEKISAQIAFAI